MSNNSQVDFYVDLVSALILSDPLALSQKEAKRDAATIAARTSTESLSFLTKTLPKLGKAVDRGLEEGLLVPPAEFHLDRKQKGIPRFLAAYLSKVFNETGALRTNADPNALKHIRTVCYLMYKLEAPYRDDQINRVVDGFVKNEAEMLNQDLTPLNPILGHAKSIIGSVFNGFDPKDIVPRHGPGAVSTGERGAEKWSFKRLYDCIHQVYPYYDYFVVGGADELRDRLGWYKTLERTPSGCAKVVLVPKDSRGPRLISAEPLEFQYVQQGLGRKMMSHLESHWLTRGHVNFTDQSINAQHALRSSQNREYATLDMKDASDLVSLELVRRLFPEDLFRYLEGTRSSSTILPDGRVVKLSKFAPMGSALCFPVEAVCFWALMVAGVSYTHGIPFNVVAKSVFVYGDDIVVPTSWADECIQYLEMAGLKINRDKCCIHGFFRESCGVDAFKGVDVTPPRVRKPWSRSISDGSAYAAYVSLLNNVRARGYALAAELLHREIEAVYGTLPYGLPNSSYPAIHVGSPTRAEALNRDKVRWRFNRKLFRQEFLVRTIENRKVSHGLDGWQRLLRDQLQPPLHDPDRDVLLRSSRIKRRWRPV